MFRKIEGSVPINIGKQLAKKINYLRSYDQKRLETFFFYLEADLFTISVEQKFYNNNSNVLRIIHSCAGCMKFYTTFI